MLLPFWHRYCSGGGRRISYSPSHARLIKHEEDWKFDVRFKTKIAGVGDRVFAPGRRVCAETGRQASTKGSRQQGNRPTQERQAAAEQQQPGQQEGRPKGKALKRLQQPAEPPLIKQGFN